MNLPHKYIQGKYSIIEASKNHMRKKRIFHGSLQIYRKLELRCSHILSSRNELEVNEYFIPYSIEEITENNKILLIDKIEDPRNLGSIIRSAAAFGYSILLRESCSINSTVVSCASGGAEHTKIATIKNTQETLNKLKKQGYFIIGLDERSDDSQDFSKLDKIILAIGSESGLSNLIKKACDIMIKLPTRNDNFTTLNASVAASIAMCQF